MTLAELTPARVARALIDLDQWRMRKLGLEIDPGWHLERQPTWISRQLLIRARSEAHFLADVGLGIELADMDPSTLRLTKNARRLEKGAFTGDNYMNAVTSCPDPETARVLDDFLFAVSVLRWHLLERQIAYEPLRPKTSELFGVRERIRACHEAIRKLHEGVDISPIGMTSHLQIFALSGNGAGLIDTLVQAVREILETARKPLEDRHILRLAASLGFSLSVVIDKLQDATIYRQVAEERGFEGEVPPFSRLAGELRDRLGPLLPDMLALFGKVENQPGEQWSKALTGVLALLFLPFGAEDQARIAAVFGAFTDVDFAAYSIEDIGYPCHQMGQTAIDFNTTPEIRGMLMRTYARALDVHFRDLMLNLHVFVPGRLLVPTEPGALGALLTVVLRQLETAPRLAQEKEAVQRDTFLDALVHFHQLSLIHGMEGNQGRSWLDAIDAVGPGAISWRIRAVIAERALRPGGAAELVGWLRELFETEIPDDAPQALASRATAMARLTERVSRLEPRAFQDFMNAVTEEHADNMQLARARRREEVMGRTLLHIANEGDDWSAEAALALRDKLRGLGLLPETDWADGQLDHLAKLAAALPVDDPDRKRLLVKLPKADDSPRAAYPRDKAAEAELDPNALYGLLWVSAGLRERDVVAEAETDPQDLMALFAPGIWQED